MDGRIGQMNRSRSQHSPEQTHVVAIDYQLESKLVLKQDLRVLPMVFLI